MKVNLIDYDRIDKSVFACLITYMGEMKDGLGTYQDISESDYYHAYNAVGSYESVLEHMYFTFYIEGISRACSHQLVRHRIASYTQRSQRHRGDEGFDYVVPHTIRNNPIALGVYKNTIELLQRNYTMMVDEFGIPKEDARYILPNACATDIMVTMNVRALREFFQKRCCRLAQWEIREVANEMLRMCHDIYPKLFEGCRGFCGGDYDVLGCPYKGRCLEVLE